MKQSNKTVPMVVQKVSSKHKSHASVFGVLASKKKKRVPEKTKKKKTSGGKYYYKLANSHWSMHLYHRGIFRCCKQKQRVYVVRTNTN